MNNDNQSSAPGYLERVIQNDTVRKGLAGALAGVLIAAVTEAVWPST